MTGTFDNWSKSYPLVKQTDGSFELNVPLDRSGEVLYKYVVDGEWTTSKDQKTTSDSSGHTNNVLEPVKAKDYKGTTSRIPEAGGIGAAVAQGSSATASSHAGDKDLKTTVLPSSEGKQTTLGEPGIFVPQAKDTEALAAFENVRDVDPKTLNEPKDDEKFTKELTPEEKKKQKKKLKKTQYKLRKKQQKQAAGGAAVGAAGGAAAGGAAAGNAGAKASGEDNDQDNDQSEDSEYEKSPEPDAVEATLTGTILGAVGGAATAGAGGALVGALGGASAGQAAHNYSSSHSEDASTTTKTEETEAPQTLDPGRQAHLNIPGSIAGVDKVPTRDDDNLATKTKTLDTLTSSEYVDSKDEDAPGSSSAAVGGAAVGVIPEDKKAEATTQDGLSKQKENTEEYPVKGDLTQAGAAAVPVTAVYEDKKSAQNGADKPSPDGAFEKQKENTELYPVKDDLATAGAAAVPATAVYADKKTDGGASKVEPLDSDKLAKNIEDNTEFPEDPQAKEAEDKDKKHDAAVVGAGAAAGVAAGAVGGTAASRGAGAAPAKETTEPAVPVQPVSQEKAAPVSKAAEPKVDAPVASKDGSEVPGVFGSGSAVTPEVGPKEVSAKEVDAAPVTKSNDHRYDSEDEIIIAQGGESVKQVEKRIQEWEGDVSVEQIQPSPSEARRLAEEAHLLKQAQLAAERAQEVASPSNPPAGPVKAEKKTPKKAQKAPNAAQQQATKTKKGILSKLKKIFK